MTTTSTTYQFITSFTKHTTTTLAPTFRKKYECVRKEKLNSAILITAFYFISFLQF